MSPDRPTTSTSSSIALARMWSHGCITPRSYTWKKRRERAPKKITLSCYEVQLPGDPFIFYFRSLFSFSFLFSMSHSSFVFVFVFVLYFNFHLHFRHFSFFIFNFPVPFSFFIFVHVLAFTKNTDTHTTRRQQSTASTASSFLPCSCCTPARPPRCSSRCRERPP